MSDMKAGERYSLSVANGRSTIIFVKLTDSALQTIEKYTNRKDSSEKPTIQFQDDKGIMKIPRDEGNESYSFSLSDIFANGLQGSFECIEQNEKGPMESLGCMSTKLQIQAKEDSYENTKVKMEAADKEQKMSCTKVINSNSRKRPFCRKVDSTEFIMPPAKKRNRSLATKVLSKNFAKSLRSGSCPSVQKQTTPKSPPVTPVARLEIIPELVQALKNQPNDKVPKKKKNRKNRKGPKTQPEATMPEKPVFDAQGNKTFKPRISYYQLRQASGFKNILPYSYDGDTLSLPVKTSDQCNPENASNLLEEIIGKKNLPGATNGGSPLDARVINKYMAKSKTEKSISNSSSFLSDSQEYVSPFNNKVSSVVASKEPELTYKPKMEKPGYVSPDSVSPFEMPQTLNSHGNGGSFNSSPPLAFRSVVNQKVPKTTKSDSGYASPDSAFSSQDPKVFGSETGQKVPPLVQESLPKKVPKNLCSDQGQKVISFIQGSTTPAACLPREVPKVFNSEPCTSFKQEFTTPMTNFADCTNNYYQMPKATSIVYGEVLCNDSPVMTSTLVPGNYATDSSLSSEAGRPSIDHNEAAGTDDSRSCVGKSTVTSTTRNSNGEDPDSMGSHQAAENVHSEPRDISNPTDLSPDWDHIQFKEVKSLQQRREYKAYFDKHYEELLALTKIVDEARIQVNTLKDYSLSFPEGSSDAKKAKKRMLAICRNYLNDATYMAGRNKLEILRYQLTCIKQLIARFDSTYF